MNGREYSVINFYNHGRQKIEYATFADFGSAKEFARACIRNRLIALPDDYGHIEIISHKEGASPYYGDRLFRIMPTGEEFEEEGAE